MGSTNQRASRLNAYPPTSVRFEGSDVVGRGVFRPLQATVRSPSGSLYRLTLVAQPSHPWRPYEVFLESRRAFLFWQFEDCYKEKDLSGAWRRLTDYAEAIHTGNFPGYD